MITTKKILLGCSLIFAMTVMSFAQSPDTIVPFFSIVKPGYLTQQYEASLSDFGQANFGQGVSDGDVVAELVLAEDQEGGTLCAANAQDFTGKIVLIERGICEFGSKVLFAQQQGAVGVIINNFEEATVEMAGGQFGSMVTIPAIMTPLSIGNALRAAVLQGETVVVAFTAAPYNFGKITGKVTGDLNSNCMSEINEPGLGNWLITAQGANQTYSVRSRSDGTYSLYADSLNSPYTVFAVPLNNLWQWQVCPPASSTVTINGGHDSATVNIIANPTLLCPQLSVEIGTPFLRRCFENWFNVEICNNGTLAAEDAYVTIHLPAPEFEPIQNASQPFTLDTGGDYRFELGTLDIGECKYLKFSSIISCDNTTIGQTLCFSAHAYPDTFCILPSLNWNGANVSVEGECDGSQQKFILQNTGSAAMMQPSTYIVLRNVELYQSGQFQFGPGETQVINLPADGATWRVEATQVPQHPVQENPSATLEGCGYDNDFDIGFALQLPVYDPSGAVDNECQEIIGSWDPNDKQGFPVGVTDQHLILPNTPLEYLIRFQNTGTDTAFNVVVRDTLSQFFDVESIRPGVASAAYEFEIADGNVLIFRFKNIKLVDSFTNEAASHGFVRFGLNQKPDLAWDTEIQNSAAIFFDFNPPVITNTTQHKLGFVQHASAVNETLILQQSNITVFPSPAQAPTALYLNKELPADAQWRLISPLGKIVESGLLQDGHLNIKHTNLTSGIYWIEFNQNGKWLGTAKWVVQ